MNRSIARTSLAVAMLAAPTAVIPAQQAVTVTGYVTSGRTPLANAHVRVDELRIDRTTDADGRYSFLVPSNSVRGQTVRMTATMQDRRVRYVPKTVLITLTGGQIAQDFDLAVAEGPEAVAPDTTRRAVQRVAGEPVDFRDVAGSIDLPSALVGRVTNLDVVAAAIPGGSPSVLLRGTHSILGPSQPLFVVDGNVLDNTVFTSSAQRFGAGGFDYGSPIADLDLGSIASIEVLRGADAAARYGSRGANGVIVVRTKNGSEGQRMAISADFQRTSGSFLRLPSYQNQYGQGLNGQFAFFNGRGGGTNDGVDESWGPRLDARPLPQASYIEAGRPDVRLWNARPDNVRDYFATGTTTNVTGAVQAHADMGSFRVFVGRRATTGITPRDELTRLTGGLNATVRPIQRLELSLSAFGTQTKNDNSPGTGYNEGNPVSQFTRMGRQVDTDSLRKHLRDATGKQINWIYVLQNNPYFASLLDSNHSRRFHGAGGASATYRFAPWLTGTARASVDDYRDGRLFTIASGWLGGFPSYTGQGDFSKGGSEGNEISSRLSNFAGQLSATRNLSGGVVWTLGAGIDHESRTDRVHSLGVDSALHVPSAGAPADASLPSAATWVGDSKLTTLAGETGFAFSNGTNLRGVLRNAWSSMLGGSQAATLYPAVSASTDLLRVFGPLRNNRVLGSATVHADWWRDGGNLTPYSIESMYAGRPVTGSVAPIGNGLLVADPNLEPEVTNGIQVGVDVGLRAHRITAGLAYYREQTTGVVLPVPTTGGAVVATNAGQVSNRGIEAQLSSQIGDGELGFQWNLSAHAAKNSNEVDKLYSSAQSLALGPTQWGLQVLARPGLPLGALTGTKLLRDGNGALLLRNGVPLPDSVAGAQLLGTAQPDWTFGIQNTLRYRWVSISAIADGRMGGSIFSATNLWGSYAGTLEATAFRPDTGLLINGIDAATGGANTKHASTQDYYHALGRIQEPWIYGAGFFKLREARLTIAVPTTLAAWVPFQDLRFSVIGRNLYSSIDAPNIDSEYAFSQYGLRGVEMGQLPTTRSVGFQVSITP